MLITLNSNFNSKDGKWRATCQHRFTTTQKGNFNHCYLRLIACWW